MRNDLGEFTLLKSTFFDVAMVSTSGTQKVCINYKCREVV